MVPGAATRLERSGRAHPPGTRGSRPYRARPFHREIARLLQVSEKTVKTHVSSVLAKLGVQDRTQAALYAVRHADRQ